MTPGEFVELYLKYFGNNASLPIAVFYSDKPEIESKTIPGCMFKQFHRAYRGETVSFCENKFTCGGGKLYLGLGPIPDNVYNFVSNIEKYKKNPEITKTSISLINAQKDNSKYINFKRIDKLDSFDNIEGLIFFANPDLLSGLFTWANYDMEDINSVQSPWGSGCSSTVTALVNENRRNGNHCFLGLFDISARPFFKSDILSFSIPMSRFKVMQETMSECCIAGAPAWEKLKKRINHK